MGKCSKFVYELVNLMGTVEYVGETKNPEGRLKGHLSKSGKFYGRMDITMHIVDKFDNRKDAFKYQCKLQKEYGLETDLEKNLKGGPSGRNVTKKSILCFDSNTNEFIKQYDAIIDAANELNIFSMQIVRVLKGIHKNVKGYRFEYVK